MTRRIAILLLSAALAFPGGAFASGVRRGTPSPEDLQRPAPPTAIADYAKSLKPGTRVRVSTATGSVLKATFMNATDEAIVVQLRTRIPEPPIEIAMRDVTSLTPETKGTGLGKAIAIGTAVGVGATFGVLWLITALVGYD